MIKKILKWLPVSLSLILRATIILALIPAILNEQWILAFLCAISLILTFLPAMIERNFRVLLPFEFEVIIVVFIYAALFLGEVHSYYTRYWWWDVVLHTGSGLVLGFVGFLIMFILSQENKVAMSPILLAMFSFSFALALGAVWEIFEFSMDSTFGFNMQKSGLVDTMWDLIVDGIGALITAALGFIYIKSGKAFIFNRYIEMFIKENPKLFNK